MSTIAAPAASGHAQAALHIAFRPGAGRAGARDRARHGRARLRRRAQDLQRRLPEADLDDRRADRVLRRGAWHRRRRRPEKGRTGRRQGAGLFRGHDHGRARRRPAARLSVRARPRHEHRSVDARCQGARHLCRQRAQAAGRRHRQLPHQHHPDHIVRRACRATTCCRSCSSRSCSASAWRWSAAKRPKRSRRSSTRYRRCCSARWD